MASTETVIKTLITSCASQWSKFTFGDKDKFSLSKSQTDEMIEQFLPFHGHGYTNAKGTFIIRAHPAGSKYTNNKGKQKRRKENSVQLLPAPSMESM